MPAPLSAKSVASLNRWSVVLIVISLLSLGYLAHNAAHNMQIRGIHSGFGFLWESAGFDIGESIFSFDSADPYWVAITVGLSNTLRVALLGIVLSTLLGVMIGVGRFSPNKLLRALCRLYVDAMRNVPLLLQLLMWYWIITQTLPLPEEAWHMSGGFYLSKAGFNFPIPVWENGYLWALIGCGLGLFAGLCWRAYPGSPFHKTGSTPSLLWPLLVLIPAGTLLGWLLGGAPHEAQFPHPGVFTIEGGGALTPEFLAILFALTFYTAGFIAEVVRGGIQSVERGQWEAAQCLGLNRIKVIRLIILPQALRVMIPPLTNQYLNLTKNSSLAVAIGYPDLVSILNTSINQTGRAIECVALIMACYLALSLALASFMHWVARPLKQSAH